MPPTSKGFFLRNDKAVILKFFSNHKYSTVKCYCHPDAGGIHFRIEFLLPQRDSSCVGMTKPSFRNCSLNINTCLVNAIVIPWNGGSYRIEFFLRQKDSSCVGMTKPSFRNCFSNHKYSTRKFYCYPEVRGIPL